MNPKSYPPQKRALLAERPREVLAFIQELPQNEVRKVARKLPPVPHGFRPGKPAELQQRIQQFVNRIRRWSDKEWDLFQEIWQLWIRCRPELDAVLTEYDNTADFQATTVVPANSPRDIGCFHRLVEASQDWKISRETIERFYTFGYFLPDEQIDQAIGLARSEADLRLLRDLEALKKQVQDLLEVVKSNGAQADAAFDSIRTIQGWRESFEKRFYQLEAKAEQIRSEVGQQLGQIRSQFEEHKGVISEVGDHLQQAVRTFTAQVAELDKRVATGLVATTTNLVPEHIPSRPADLELNAPETARNTLKENLRAIGIQSQAADALAVEVLAAALAGEAILFRGSMATIVAEVCARTLAAEFSYRLQIPLGLLDGRPFGVVLDKLLSEVTTSNRVTPLIIEGINISAAEVYAGRLRRLIAERLLGLDRASASLLVIGTVVDGVAALPLAPTLSEIGPVFDLDCLVWRNRWPERRITGGWISRSNWELWGEGEGDAPADWEDIWRESIHLVGPGTPLWQRSVYTAFTRLSRFAHGDVRPTALQSLVYGWILPRVIALGNDPREKRNLLPAGVLDGERPDNRIARLLGDGSGGVES